MIIKIRVCKSFCCESIFCSNLLSGVECPTCGLICEAEKIIDNQFLLELSSNEDTTAKVTELKCSSCSDDNIATSWCVDCAEYICDICVQAHQRY